MKKTVILSALLILAFSPAFSQQGDTIKVTNETSGPREPREMQTLLGHNHQGGGYGAFSIGYSVIDHRQAVLFGRNFICSY